MNKKYLFILIAACVTLTLGCARIDQKASNNRIKSLTPGYVLVEIHKQYIPEPKKYLKGFVAKIAIISPEKNSTYNNLVYKELQGFLWEIPTLKLIERRNMETILREHKLQLSGLITEKDRIKIGNILGATHLLYFDIDIIESEGFGSLSLHASIPIYIYNVATGETEYFFNANCYVTWNVHSVDSYIHELINKTFRDKAFRDNFILSVLFTAQYHAVLSLSKAFQYEYDPLGIIFTSTPDQRGVKISFVAANSPAEEAGLDTVKKVDLSNPDNFFTSVDAFFPTLLEIDDMEIQNYSQIAKYMAKKKAGDTVRLKIKQLGEIRTVNIKLKYFW
jgi:hypothetical protein